MDLAVEIVVGLVVGLVMGALGGGGGIITVPALVYLLGLAPALATTTSLVVVGISSLSAVNHHARKGAVAWADGLVFAVLGAGGAILGSTLAAGADPDLTMGLFAALLTLVATLMWRRASGASAGSTQEREPWLTWSPFSLKPGRAVVVLLCATVVGLLTGFFGVGGGFAIVPALTLVLGMPMRRAVGTSLLVISVNSAVGLLGRLGTSIDLDRALIAVVTLAAIAGSLLGGRIGERLEPRRLQQGFALLLLAVAAYTALSTFLL